MQVPLQTILPSHFTLGGVAEHLAEHLPEQLADALGLVHVPSQVPVHEPAA